MSEHREPAERWVRFHSLPGAKRYADTDAERAELLRRHHVVLDLLRGEEPLVVPGGLDLDVLLLAVADDRHPDAAVIGDATGEWRYHPYDGGADVIARSAEERDELAAEFSAWRSERPDGL